jgi:uncharacterized protein with HEPN domain
MRHDDLVYVGHMLDKVEQALSLVEGKSRADFDVDVTLRLALTHLLQVIGEATRQVSQPFRDRYPDIPWNAIEGMRHKIVHDYMDVDEDIVWDTVTTELRPLLTALRGIGA